MTREIYGRTAAGALAGGQRSVGDATGGDVHLQGSDGGVQKLGLLAVGPGVHLGRERTDGLLGIAQGKLLGQVGADGLRGARRVGRPGGEHTRRMGRGERRLRDDVGRCAL